jgi:hypothetical protein
MLSVYFLECILLNSIFILFDIMFFFLQLCGITRNVLFFQSLIFCVLKKMAVHLKKKKPPTFYFFQSLYLAKDIRL